MSVRKFIDLSSQRENGLPEVLLSGVFRVPITDIDIYPIERWNGLQVIATSMQVEIHLDDEVFFRRIQLMHPMGVYPFPQYKIDAIRERELSGWKGFLLSVKASDEEIQMVSSSFLEYPVQGTKTLKQFYVDMETVQEEIKSIKKVFSDTFCGRKCLVQIVDSGSKDHTGSKRNFALNQFLSEKAGECIFKNYKENLGNDITLSEFGAGIMSKGYGATK
jgi:hypothetical protein